MEKSTIQKNFPRMTSSTRLVLLGLVFTLIILALYTGITWKDTFPEILKLLEAILLIVVGFFFWQRDTEHKTFSNQNENDLFLEALDESGKTI